MVGSHPTTTWKQGNIFFRKNVIILLSKPLSGGPESLICKEILASGHYSHSMVAAGFSEAEAAADVQ